MEASESIDSEPSSAAIANTRMVLRFDLRAARKQEARAKSEPEPEPIVPDAADAPLAARATDDPTATPSAREPVDPAELAKRTARMPVPESVRLLQAAIPTPAGCFSTARLPPAVVPPAVADESPPVVAESSAPVLADCGATVVAGATDAYAAEPPAAAPTFRYAPREVPARPRPAVTLRDATNAALAAFALLGAGSLASALVALVLFP